MVNITLLNMNFKKSKWSFILLAAGTLLLTNFTKAQTITKLWDFSTLEVSNAPIEAPNPIQPLLQGNDGNFYGTLAREAFKVTTNGDFTLLYGQFGTEPTITWGNEDNFYGGDHNVLYSLTPTGTYTGFNSDIDNMTYFYGSLVLGNDGYFYGTAREGGDRLDGAVFRMTTNGAVTVLASFSDTSDPNLGFNPNGELAQGNDGNFYGTTEYGGNYNQGTLFTVATNGAFLSLVSLNTTNGAQPQAGMRLGPDGNFYGTTSLGGDYGYGTIFRYSPTLLLNGLTTLISFTGTNGDYPGANPQSQLVLGNDGDLYGVTFAGGVSNNGTVFKITPGGAFRSLGSFNDSTGINPNGLTLARDGNFYGTTESGGTSSKGIFFKFALPPQPGLAVSIYSNQPAIFFPASNSVPFVLQMSTNLASGNWTDVTNGIPIAGVIVTNPPPNAFFRLN